MSVGLDPRVGTELVGYRIEAVLGRGGMGVVYLAEDLRLKWKVALKLLAPELAADERFRERFLRESELAASLDHPNVIPIYEAGEAEGVLYIAMRFVEGTDLKTLLGREGRLESRRTLALVGQVAEALDTAHEHGLVHRDVKPGNVLLVSLGGREHCYLSDFGLTKATSSDSGLTETGQFVGTADYVAPEQIDRRPVDGRADVYSLGCVLFECLTGEPPYKSDRLMATLWSHLNASPPRASERNAELPAGLDPVLARALAKDPADRDATCRELVADAWRELGLSGELPQAFAPPSLVWRWRWLVAAVAAGVVVLAAVLAVVLTRGGEEDAVPAPILPVTGESLVALPVTENTLLRIDPHTGEPIAAVQLGEDPTHLAAGEGSVWIVDSREHSLLRVDPQRDAVVDSVDISPFGPGELPAGDKRVRVGAGAVWLNEVGAVETVLWKYEPSSDVLSPFAERFFFTLIEAGEGGVWIDDIPESKLIRLEAATGHVVETIRHDAQTQTYWAIGDRTIWYWRAPVGIAADGVVERIDRETGEIVASVATGLATIDDMAFGEGGVWVLGDGESLVRIDPATNSLDQTIRVGRSTDSMALGEGFVWVGSSRDGTVTRVDPVTADLLTVDVGGRPRAIAVAEGSVWVIVRPA